MSDPQTLSNGRYLLVKRLGEGGMATVYRGFDQRLQVWRAIKVLLPEYARKKKIMARFETEAQTMAMLEHPNIVRVYDVDREGDFPYIVMELVEGGCLVDWLEAHGPMPPRMALDVIVETCQALQFSHERKIIHRDIKPHNIMIDRKGVCRLTDFGIARAGDADDALTKTGAVMGTWGFMAPEQRTDAKHVDGRADIYAMAATLFSLITDQTPMDLFLAARETTMLEGIPEPLVPVLVQATEYRKEERYPTATSFAAALLEVRESLPDNPSDTPPLVGDVQPLPPPPEEIASSSEEPGARRAPGGGKDATLMPSDGTAVGPNFTLPPRDDDAFESDASQGPQGLPPADAQAKERKRALAWLGVGAGVIGALAVVLAMLWADGRSAVDPSEVGAIEQAPTPVEAAGTPGAEDDQAREAQAEAEDGGEAEAPPTEEAASPKPSRPSTASKAPARTESPSPPSPKNEQAPPSEEAPPAPAPTPPPAPPKAQAFKSVQVPASVAVGSTLSVRAKMELSDADVVLHYRPKGTQGSWHTKKLSMLMGSRATTVQIRPEYADGVEWYLKSQGVTYGSATQPKLATVTGGQASP